MMPASGLLLIAADPFSSPPRAADEIALLMNETALATRPRVESATPVAGGYALHTAEQAYRQLLATQPRHFRALCGLAAVRSQLGAVDEARELMGQAVAVAGQSVEDQIALGTTYIRINDFESAHHHLDTAVGLDQGNAEARFHLANVLCGRGKVAEAVNQYERVLAIAPGNAEAHQNLGLALQRLGQFQSALSHHEAALAISPKSAAVHVSLGDAYRHIGRYDAAIAQYAQALAINPALTDAHINLGGCFHAAGRREQAIRSYQRALTINPGLAAAHYNLGNLYTELDNVDAAIVHYERSIAMFPTSAEAHNNLANVLRKRGRHEDAVEHYKNAIRLKPTYISAQRSLGDALQSQNQLDGAIVCYRAALASEPKDIPTLNRLASALLIAGRLDEASRAFETALELGPDNIGIQHNYASVRSFVHDDRRLTSLAELHGREASLSDEQRIVLHFTLGKAYADLKDADRSFHHLDAGNRLKRQRVTYDERGTLLLMQRIRDVFTKDLLRAKSNVGHASEAPVFVVGMPRSGTTLVEQILASHPRVFGAGEVRDFVAAASVFSERTASGYPEMLAKLSDDDLRELGKTYVERLSTVGAGKDRIVDKLPSNFLFVGLIRLVLPNARIIHIKRNPVDNCLSCFSLLFEEDQPFSYDLGEMGRYYKAYDGLMDHWRSVLPSGGLLDVQYEDLVGDLEGQARRLVAYCGLDWDKRCLAFHETKRPVNTASLVQVRKSIYTSSVGRSRFYGPRLKPLMEALGLDGPSSSSRADQGVTASRSKRGSKRPATVESPSSPPAPVNREAEVGKPEAWTDLAFEAAKKLQDRGDLINAEQLFRAVLALRATHFGSLLGLGTICASTNRLDDAKRYFMQAIAVDKDSAEAHGSLGAVYASAGDSNNAVVYYEKALALAPDHPGIHYAFAALLHSLGKHVDAIEHLKRTLTDRPDHLDAYFTLGNALYAINRDVEAIQCYLKVLELSPRHPETHNNLANVYQRTGQMERAIFHYKAAIEIKPDYADAYGNLGNALLVLERLEESMEQNRRALELKPARFGSYNNLGVALQALGRFEEAEAAFGRALELAPREASIHLNLANMGRFKPGDRRLPGLRTLLGEVESLETDHQIAAHFAMGKALSDLKHHDDAFRHLLKGNALKRRITDYDEPQRLAMFENVRTTFTSDFMKARSGDGDTSWSPIFIVGMPRSGTTLMEQVLASHSKVFGAGELETFKDAISETVNNNRILPAYPMLAESLSKDQIRQLGESYTKGARARAPEAERIVDKMPLNFMFVGLIHLALPNARIINIRRDPLDTCVSCFSLLFTGSQPFAYDLGELGRYHRGYETVMEHWHKVLPPGVMIDVQYEALVDDLEGVSRRVLRHCGLDWEDACRDFHDTKRAVRTASLMQVREPVYRRAIGNWQRYRKHLGPLAEALGVDISAKLPETSSVD
jgi:tetratricopeptide (TPR) repeat protein